MGTDKEEADDLVAQMNEAQRILDIHSEDELVKRTGKYPGDYLRAGASEIAALRSRVEQMKDALRVYGRHSPDCRQHKECICGFNTALSTPTGPDNAAPLKTEGGT